MRPSKTSVCTAGVAALLGMAGCAATATPAKDSAATVATSAPVADVAAATTTPLPQPVPGPDGRLANLEMAALYSGRAPDLTGYDPARIRIVVATGDLVPARMSNYTIVHSGDFTKPWLGIRPLLKSGDITLFNLGDPQLNQCPIATTGSTFCGDVRNIAPMLASGNADVVNVANNHITNFGQAGLDETVSHLQSGGAVVSGFAHIAVRDVRGVRFVFVGFDFVAHRPTHAQMATMIQQARTQGDVVVASIHAGHEYETYPEAGLSEDPKVLDRLAIDAGADIVIGNFPHCLEGSELYKGHLIAYAHGNFLFDQTWSVGTQESVVGKYYFYDRQLIGVEYVPIRVVNATTPTPLDPAAGEGRRILDRALRSSEEIAGLRSPYFPDLSDGNNACT